MKLVLFGRKISPEFKAIASNTGWLFFDRVLRMGVGFIFSVWIARYLGVQQYGLFSYATAFVYLFNPLIMEPKPPKLTSARLSPKKPHTVNGTSAGAWISADSALQTLPTDLAKPEPSSPKAQRKVPLFDPPIYDAPPNQDSQALAVKEDDVNENFYRLVAPSKRRSLRRSTRSRLLGRSSTDKMSLRSGA